MIFTHAFEALGYKLASPRQDWSAEKPDGVAISIWRVELDSSDGELKHDSRVNSQPLEQWRSKPGNAKRIRHLSRALEEFDGWIDVVIVHGEPGGSYKDADPWIPAKRQGHQWRVTYLDPATGHARVERQQRH